MPSGRSRRQIIQRFEAQRRRNRLLARPGVHAFVLVLDHLKAGFNVAKIFRSAQAFGAREVHLIGIGAFDPSPAKGAFKAVPARFHDDFLSCRDQLVEQGYALFALDPHGGTPLFSAPLPEDSAFLFGHEEMGLSFDARSLGVRRLAIPRFGPMESLNVSVAASIVMYEYVRQHGKKTGVEPI
jgi:tRNA G18 (ribose-2'-O)-methylase SpoU